MQPQSETSASAHYDAVIIGGAFAGASAALLLRRELPEARILIVERKAIFGRKVGEATVEVAANFLHRVLGLYDYLSREHLPKHGLRFWFSDRPDRTLSEMTEVGSTDMPRLPSFQLDRSRLDESLLASAADESCEIARPARVVSITHDWPASEVRFTDGDNERHVTARWIIDASGRRAFIARERGLHQSVDAHPTAAVWARWRNAKDLDSPSEALPPVHASRRLATNHFCGYGWWCWVIPLAGGETSIGLVYNKELVDLRGDGGLRERYERFLTGQPGLREMLRGASMDEDDFHALSQLPYKTARYMDRGWGLVGDAASFMDPYYSPGLDHAAFSVYATSRIVAADIAGQLDEAGLDTRIGDHNDRFLRSFDRWLSALYVGKYELMGDAELTRCAFLLDTSLYYLGIVGPVCTDSEGLKDPPFGAPILPVRLSYQLIRFYNRRLQRIARARREAGTYGRRNAGWRPRVRPFGLRAGSLRPLAQGLASWFKLELDCLGLQLRHRLRLPSPSIRPLGSRS